MSDKKMTFEEASQKLDGVIRRMEDKSCPLDESIKLYEEAYRLIVYCKEQLETARGSIVDINEKIASLKNKNTEITED